MDGDGTSDSAALTQLSAGKGGKREGSAFMVAKLGGAGDRISDY